MGFWARLKCPCRLEISVGISIMNHGINNQDHARNGASVSKNVAARTRLERTAKKKLESVPRIAFRLEITQTPPDRRWFPYLVRRLPMSRIRSRVTVHRGWF